jgi:hypothetical protein
MAITKPDAIGSDVSATAAISNNPLVFVGMSPCRIADTRDATFPNTFGPPILSGGTKRTFDIQSMASPVRSRQPLRRIHSISP